MPLWLRQHSRLSPWSPGHSPADSWPPVKSLQRKRPPNHAPQVLASGRVSTDRSKYGAYSPTRPSKPIFALDVIKRFLRAWDTTWQCLKKPPIYVGTGTTPAGIAKRRLTRRSAQNAASMTSSDTSSFGPITAATSNRTETRLFGCSLSQ